jgi:hypothetical protein
MSQQAKIEIESDSESLAEAAARLLLKWLVDRDAAGLLGWN